MALETTYTCISKTGGQLFFKFDLNGYLIEFKYSGRELTETAANYVHKVIVKRKDHMSWFYQNKAFEVIEGKPNLSFDVFWKAYDKKAKKEVCRGLWKKLKDDDKFNAIMHIRRYDNWLRQQGTAKALPDTYLRQKRWLDEL